MLLEPFLGDRCPTTVDERNKIRALGEGPKDRFARAAPLRYMAIVLVPALGLKFEAPAEIFYMKIWSQGRKDAEFMVCAPHDVVVPVL